MNNTPAQNKLAIKIAFNDDIRRVSVDPSSLNFSVLKETIKRLFKTLTGEEIESLSIKYQDDESDWISISSDEELTEAVALLPASNTVLRLFLCARKPAHPERERRCHGPGGRCGMGKRFGGRARFFWLQSQGLRLLQAGTPESIKQARVHFEEQLSMFEHPTPIYNIACCEALLGNSKEALVYLKKAVDAGFSDVSHIENDSDLSSLRNLEEYKAIVASLKSSPPSQNSSGHCGGWRRWGGGRGRFFHLHHQAIKLMGTGNPADIESARALFQAQLEMVEDAPSPLYNIACCEALLGNTSEAIHYLKKAVKAGYNNAAHMESDSDLKSLRGREDFNEIIRSLKPGSSAAPSTSVPVSVPVSSSVPILIEEPSTPVPSAPVPSAPPAIVLPQPSSSSSAPQSSALEENLKILEAMGFLDRQLNIEALGAANGDLSAAVQAILLRNNQRKNGWF